ncbi:MAG: hypothetical protein NTW01_17395 [Gammaproteobacteria bacterium]|jgi:hypothetical protein|uniref:hypothetical protein n=1 Tax=Nevskia sp. TaxID=1929292 RepID=UPI00403626EF|nr:hypothetical protein [Gammaproteobacteria bacterium]
MKRLIGITMALTLAGGLAGCADDASNLIGGTTSGTTGGTTGGTTSGTTAGTTGGTTSGTTAGTTGGTTSGTTAGTTGGTTSGVTGGTTGGTTTGGDIGGIVCNPTSDTFRPIRQPNAAATGQTNGICIGCSVGNPENAIDDDFTTVAALNTPVGLLSGSSQLNVIDTAQTYPAGRRAGFVVFDPAGALLTLNLLQSVSIVAANNGMPVDMATVPPRLALDLLGTRIIGNEDAQFLSFVPTAEFNELRLSFGGLLGNVLAQLGVVHACVSVNPAVLP